MVNREELSRIVSLVGEEAVERLANAKIAVFGLGGVGGFAAEALVRSGVGALDIVDGDTVALSNLNRQIIALHSTVGMWKTDACEQRFIDINPEIKIRKFPLVFSEETAAQFDFSEYDYVVDAIDDVRAKVLLAVKCGEADTPIISSMGAGNKLHPELFRIADIYKTSVCPLARTMRHELRKRGVERLKALYSTEEPYVRKAGAPASIAFVPSVAGLMIAGEVIRDIAGINS
ncbi:MAG: ThiF family adenylyltransferase [Oscillospiraceae bacterium]